VRPSGTPCSVLVVEDEWLVRDLIVQNHRAADWQVLQTGTAEDAIAHAQARHSIDVVFTDIQLAGPLTGWDVAEEFRAVRADVPIIYASGNVVDRSRRVPNSLFFEKPYELFEIVEACHRLFQRV
jgi:two-component system, OmpR family, response regulator